MRHRSSLKSTGSAASKFFTPIFLVIILFSACNEDPTFLGRNLLPPTDDVFTKYSNDTSISSISSYGKPILTSINSVMLLGSKADTIFGKTKGDFMTRFYLVPTTIGPDRTVDSLVLNMRVVNYSGDSEYKPMMRIFELTDTLSLDTVYYSDERPDNWYDPGLEIAHQEISPLDTIISVKITHAGLLEKFSIAPDSIFLDIYDFWDLFKGFYITTDDVVEGGNILYVDMHHPDTDLFMYYKDDTTGTKEFNMYVNVYSQKVNSFYNDYTGSRAIRSIDFPDEQDTLMFLSSMAGLDTKIYFDELETWLDSLPVAINNAKLYIPAADTLITGEDNDNYPDGLLLFSCDEEDNFDYLYDYRMDPDGTYFGGYYSLEDDSYVFNIGMHLQAYINGDITNPNMILLSKNNSLSDSRVILNSATAKARKMSLKITYTKF